MTSAGTLGKPGTVRRGSRRGAADRIFLVSLALGCVVAASFVWSRGQQPVNQSSPTGAAPAAPLPAPTALPAPAAAPAASDLDLSTEVYFRILSLAYVPPGAGGGRSQEEARALATEVLSRARAGEDFGELVRAHSDHPSKEQGGTLPRVRLGQLPRPLAETLAAMTIGETEQLELADRKELILVQRLALPPTLAAQQILIRSAVSSMGGASANRTPEAALELAREVIAKATVTGADFGALVEEYSEDPGKAQGGRVGPFQAEQMAAEYSTPLLAVAEWEIVPEPIPTQAGYFVVRRIPLDETEPVLPALNESVPAPISAPDPSRTPSASEPTPATERATALEILIAYDGAQRANRRIKRTREVAEARARALVLLARSTDQDFALLVAHYSEDRSLSSTGGSVGILERDRPLHAGHAAIMALRPGNVSDPIETPAGFHIFQRVPIEELGLREILITHAGARNASPTLERTREEARGMIDAAYARLQAGESFADVARTVSDQRRSSGGALGALYRGHPFFSQFPGHGQRAFALKMGEYSEVFESDWGFHIIAREEVLRARHLRVAYKDKLAVPPPARQRTREEAEAIIKDLQAQLAAGASFEQLITDHSDDTDRGRGGDTGVFGPGQRDDNVFATVAGLEEGELCPPLETRFGLELYQRLPLTLDAPPEGGR